MSATLYKEVSYSLSKLIHDIEFGEIGLPDIQRPFVWPNAKIRDLFDSMYKGFPVGYLLFWASGLPTGTKSIGTNSKQKAARLLIVDGQQRLTSLFAVIKGHPVIREDFTEQRIQIAFRPADQSFEVADAANRRDPEFIADISELWSGAVPRNRFVKSFIEKLRTSRLQSGKDLTDDEEDKITEAIDHLYDIQNYPFTAMELSPSVDEEQVAEVFVRINSKGKVLNQSDFILTLMSVFWDEGRKDLEEFAKNCKLPTTGTASPFNLVFQPSPDQLLRVAVGLGFRRARLQYVYWILRGKDLETGEFSDALQEEQFGRMKGAQAYALNLSNWHEFLNCLLRAGFRSPALITSNTAVVYSYLLFLLGKRDFKVERKQLNNLISRWFFMSILTGRYTGSPESRMEEDLARLRGESSSTAFVNYLESAISTSLSRDYWQVALPAELEKASARSPQQSGYYAALCVLGAKALFSDLLVRDLLDPSRRGKRAPLERHHLFPKAYLKKSGFGEQSDTNQVANYTLIEWPDNQEISDESPASYFPRLCSIYRAPGLREEVLRHHALEPGWENLDYPTFLRKRRMRMAEIIQEGFMALVSSEVP